MILLKENIWGFSQNMTLTVNYFVRPRDCQIFGKSIILTINC